MKPEKLYANGHQQSCKENPCNTFNAFHKFYHRRRHHHCQRSPKPKLLSTEYIWKMCFHGTEQWLKCMHRVLSFASNVQWTLRQIEDISGFAFRLENLRHARVARESYANLLKCFSFASYAEFHRLPPSTFSPKRIYRLHEKIISLLRWADGINVNKFVQIDGDAVSERKIFV